MRETRKVLSAAGFNVVEMCGFLNAGWGMLRQLLVEKAASAARTIVEVDPKYTSQECSECGLRNAASRKSQAAFVCVSCAYTANADSNAARVILKKAKLSPVGSFRSLDQGVDLRSALSSGRTRLMSEHEDASSERPPYMREKWGALTEETAKA